jgi:hypothetical protein
MPRPDDSSPRAASLTLAAKLFDQLVIDIETDLGGRDERSGCTEEWSALGV